MKITLEQIDLIRKRAKVSYNDAKDALEKCNSDTVEALIYLENNRKIKGQNVEHCTNKFTGFLKNLYRKSVKTRFIISKNNNIIINFTLLLTIILGIIITPPVFLICIAIAFLTGHKIRLHREDGEDIDVNKVFDDIKPSEKTNTENKNSAEL